MVLVAFFITIVASAQTTQEVVYLKNGSIVRGVIIEQIPNESLKIQTADGSVFVYKMNEVQKIAKEQAKSNRSYGEKYYNAGWNEFTFDLGSGKIYYTGKGDAADEDAYFFSFNYARGIHLSRDNGFTMRPGIGILVGSLDDDSNPIFTSITPKIDFGYHVTWPNSSISIFPYIGLTTRINVWGQYEDDYYDETYDLFDSDEGDADRFQIGARIGLDAHFNKFVLGLTYDNDISEFADKLKIWTINLKLGWCF